MFTLGYRFKPWLEAKAIADGPSIRKYVRDTATDNGIDKHIRFHHLVKRADWSTQTARWTVEAEVAGRTATLTCNFLFMCSGYYDYRGGYSPEFPGRDSFAGKIVHPQFWPEDLDYTGKKVVVIGSGATAVTVVPEMAKEAAHDTMLQRSPTYVVSTPRRRRDGQHAARRSCRSKLAYFADPLAQCAVRPAVLSPRAQEPAEDEREPDQHGQKGNGSRTTTSRRDFPRRATTRGTSASVSFPTATCSTR